jgi:hypothetical protein
MATLLLAHLRLFLNNVQLDSDHSTVNWICKQRQLTLAIRYILPVTMSQILKFNKKREELLKNFKNPQRLLSRPRFAQSRQKIA